jgi:beta-lactamase regulating signal transducer with metallopeptidase domain
MSTFSLDPFVSAALWIAIKATALLAVAALVQAATFRRTSAAARHLIWALGMSAVLLLPILSLALPKWAVVYRVPPPEAADAAPLAPAVETDERLHLSPASAAEIPAPVDSARPPVGRAWPAAIAGVYVLGVLVLLIRLAAQRRTVRRLARESMELLDPEWARLLCESAASMGIRRPVCLLRSRECNMPMSFGTRRSAILIPATADTWPEDRRRAVLLHELAHVARYDCLTQLLALGACTMYWFHPAAWWAARRLRIERELACDDRVISAGARPREYAGHLLDIAYSFGRHRAPALAVPMARPRQLEGRMLAVLDAARNRSVPPMRARVAGTMTAAVVLVALASATSTVIAVAPATTQTVAAAVVPAPERETATDRRLVEWSLIESARRVVRSAAEAIGVAQDRLPGTWEIRPTNTQGTVHLRLVELNSSSGSDVPVDRLEGLTPAQLTGAGGPIQFRLRRDAGTFTFEGVIRNGVGAGTFSFAPDAKFPDELAKRGFERPTAIEQYQLARHDIGYAFVDELNTQRYAKPRTSDLVRAGQHGVQVSYLREMGALGYRLGTLEPLIELRDHGVTPLYVRQLSDQGYKGLPADDLRRARDHGITPEYVRAMQEAGYSALPMEQLINARDHGVSAEYVRELGDLGYRTLPLDELIRVRDHGVGADYARGLRELGYQVSVNELVRARDHGVDVEFVRGMTSLGYSGLPLDSLVRLRDHGVTPRYGQDLKALGYDRLSVDDLVTLRDYGLTAERIRDANARAATRLPVDMLKRLAAGGMR